MDYLKTEAPFWKKETTAQGDRWIEAKNSDTKKSQDWL
jgi:molybdopterin synthase catalytic subunit